MTTRLEGQIAIVTGAADGIGHAIADLFCREGAKVCVADINKSLGEAYVTELKAKNYDAMFVETDIASRSAVEAMVAAVVAEFGAPNILVNNAGLIKGSPDPLKTSDELWERSFAVNVDGMWNCCRAVLPYMIEAKGGTIVNIASVHAFKIVPGYFPYAITKHAIMGLTRNLAVEYACDNIRVNALCPGMVETPAAFKAWAAEPDPAAAREAVASIHPLKRNASTAEMAYPALFLASHESSFMTGQCLVVDGGRSVVYCD
ncbi:MAG: SDR family oxidoreductase [Asticcacaulis sp.]